MIFKIPKKKVKLGWLPYFAWLPVKLHDGRMAWFHEVECYYWCGSVTAYREKGSNYRIDCLEDDDILSED